MNEKEQQLSFEKGITNVPSDALCSDNALADSRDLVYDNGEHKVIQRPVVHMDNFTGCHEMPNFLYIHKTSIDVYIGYFESSKQITFGYRDTEYPNFYVHLGHFIDFRYNSSTQITSTGKTIIISNDEGMHYFMWDADTKIYSLIGNKIPEPKIRFWLEGGEGKFEFPSGSLGLKNWYDLNFGFDGDVNLPFTVINKASTVGIIVDRDRKREPLIETDADGKYNDLIVGLYSKNKKAICQKKAFCEPFFVRYALRLYDDSLYYISNPILMFPSVTKNTYFMYANDPERLVSFTKFCYLCYKMEIDGDLEKFSDIVKDVDIFVSDGMSIYDTSVQQPLITLYGQDEGQSPKPIFDGVYYKRAEGQGDNVEDLHSNFRSVTPTSFYHYYIYPESHILDGYRIECLQRKDPEEIKKNIKEQSIFYKICSIGLRTSSGSTADFIETHTLENLTTQEQLEYDDYFSRCRLYPDNIYTYNSRLNLANVGRSFFEGYDFFMPFVANGITGGTYDFYVTIKTDMQQVTVRHTANVDDHIQGIFFYYPDSRAKHVIIMKDDTCILNEDLKEHGGLNGAFYFKGLPGIDENDEPSTSTPTIPRYNNNAIEQLGNYIVTSEVNNPFVFKAEGYNKVGTGKILGMSTITQALSQGQFGQFPLLVFSESGIWAMDLDKTGLFISVHPMSREVCNNAKSITQTDGAVFFTSEKGLMVITGSDVRCVSEQLSGKVDTFPSEYIGLAKYDFKTFLSKGCIAYDYRDSLLWILGGNASYSYIYSIKSGTFSMCSISPNTRIINNYPDTLIQLSDNTVVSLLERVDINKDEGEYGGTIVTRPMKFENALALKSLLQVRHVTDMQGTLKLRIFASNNFNKWVELHSLSGMPWKYYRFAYTFENLKATDRFAGSVVITQERRTDKIR